MWSRRIPFELGFIPQVLEDGSILFTQTCFRVGDVNIPIEMILQLVKSIRQ